MELTTLEESGVLTVQPQSDRLDAANAADLKAALAGLVDEGNSRLVLDLSAIDFVDSSGLNVIIATVKLLGREGSLSIAGPRPAVSSLLSLTRLDRVLRIFPDRANAVRKLCA